MNRSTATGDDVVPPGIAWKSLPLFPKIVSGSAVPTIASEHGLTGQDSAKNSRAAILVMLDPLS